MWQDVLAVVLFLSLGVSVAILLTRMARRGRTSGDPAVGGGPGVGSGRARPRPGEVEEEDSLPPRPAGERPVPPPQATPPVPGASTAPTRSAEHVIGPEANRAPVPPQQRLATLLNGIQLPCGLLPHVAPDQPDPDHYVSLITTEAGGAEVAGALADELERLGYEVFALTEDDLTARRGDDLLSARVHPRAGVAQTAGVVLFPDAPTSATAVELWSGGGPSPRHP